MSLETIVIAAMPAILVIYRNVMGFVKKATAKNSRGGKKITRYEWKQLGITFGHIGLYSILVYLGMNGASQALGVEAGIAPEFATAIGTIVHMVKGKFGK